MASWQIPTPEQIESVVANLKGNLKSQFFAKLENPEWFEPLNERGLLWYAPMTNEYGSDGIEWIAIPYIKKISSEISDKVLEFIRPILSNMDNGSLEIPWLAFVVVSFALEMPNEQFLKIITSYDKYLQSTQTLFSLDENQFTQLLEKLKPLDKTLTLNVCRHIFAITMKPTGNEHYRTIEPCAKLQDWAYGKILKIAKKQFADSKLDLLELFVNIIVKDRFVGMSEEKIKDDRHTWHFSRPAIEEHPQNHIHGEPIQELVSAIRDVSMDTLRTGTDAEIVSVFNLLESANNLSMRRIILHLLRYNDNYDKELLEKYITDKDLFDDSDVHYDYFHLLQDKFAQISENAQNIILGYIDAGSDIEYYQKDEPGRTIQQKQDGWRLSKLEPIRDSLPLLAQEKYKHILFDEQGNKRTFSDHPDFLIWSGAMTSWGDGDSPLDKETFAVMTIDDIVNYLNTWEQKGDGFNTWSRHGLAKMLNNDATENSSRYFDNLIKFKAVKDPTYVSRLLSALQTTPSKTDAQWAIVFDFAKWVMEQNETFDDRLDFRGDRNWGYAKSNAIELLMTAFSSKANLATLDDHIVNTGIEILKTSVLQTDEYLDKRESKQHADDYLTAAINSFHGRALEALVYSALWMKWHNKSTDDIRPTLEQLIQKPPYAETLAIFAKTLPWLNYAIPDLIKDNLDNYLLPEDIDKRENFNVVWLTYIFYSPVFDDMFKLLEDKYKFVLREKLYADNEVYKREERRTAERLAVHYGRELFDTDSEILKLMFGINENVKEQKGFVCHIGFSMYDHANQKNDAPIPQEIIDRFVKFWNWLLEYIRGKESDYTDTLSEFERWYQCEKFNSQWALEQLYNLVVEHNVQMHLFMVDEQLLKDLPKHPRMVLEIVANLTVQKNSMESHSNNNIIEEVVKYIHENNFDDPTIKTYKDSFIEKYLQHCDSWCVESETKKYINYLDKK